MSGPSNDPVVQAFQVLVAGTGYNFYGQRNTMRADDLLIRQKASSALAEGARAIAATESEYRRKFIPPASRDNPFPPPAEMEALRSLGRLRARLDDLAAQIAGMPVPAQDKTWWRFRDEKETLARLLQFDYQLALQCDALSRSSVSVSADSWHADVSPAPFETAFQCVEALIRERGHFLSIG